MKMKLLVTLLTVAVMSGAATAESYEKQRVRELKEYGTLRALDATNGNTVEISGDNHVVIDIPMPRDIYRRIKAEAFTAGVVEKRCSAVRGTDAFAECEANAYIYGISKWGYMAFRDQIKHLNIDDLVDSLDNKSMVPVIRTQFESGKNDGGIEAAATVAVPVALPATKQLVPAQADKQTNPAISSFR